MNKERQPIRERVQKAEWKDLCVRSIGADQYISIKAENDDEKLNKIARSIGYKEAHSASGATRYIKNRDFKKILAKQIKFSFDKGFVEEETMESELFKSFCRIERGYHADKKHFKVEKQIDSNRLSGLSKVYNLFCEHNKQLADWVFPERVKSFKREKYAYEELGIDYGVEDYVEAVVPNKPMLDYSKFINILKSAGFYVRKGRITDKETGKDYGCSYDITDLVKFGFDLFRIERWGFRDDGEYHYVFWKDPVTSRWEEYISEKVRYHTLTSVAGKLGLSFEELKKLFGYFGFSDGRQPKPEYVDVLAYKMPGPYDSYYWDYEKIKEHLKYCLGKGVSRLDQSGLRDFVKTLPDKEEYVVLVEKKYAKEYVLDAFSKTEAKEKAVSIFKKEFGDSEDSIVIKESVDAVRMNFSKQSV